jgi:integrase
LNFAYVTGLRASELVSVTLGDIRIDAQGDHWIHLVGAGQKRRAISRYRFVNVNLSA